MTQGPNIQSRLREGIDAAKRGDRLTARRLLQQVLTYDRNNELALMWMASVVDTLEERRSFLQRALQVNPNNARAREALRRLGGDDSGSVPPPTTPYGETGSYLSGTASRASSNNNVYLLLAGVVVVVVILIVGVILLNPARNAPPTPTESSLQLTYAALVNPTGAPTRDSRPPTATVFQGVIVTIDPNQSNPLPATFTPTFTPTDTPTPFPSATPYPLGSFKIIYSDLEPNAAQPSLYSGNANGVNEIKLESGAVAGFSDIAVSPDGTKLAFVRMVPGIGDDATSFPELFLASLNDLTNATQLTTFGTDILAHPSWSPDGDSILFTSNSDGDEEIFRINTQTNDIVQMTSNTDRDFDASYSPDGSLIVYASDFETPLFSEIYQMPAAGGSPTRLTDESGSSYYPAYSPDGKHIAFLNDAQGDSDLYVMDPDGQRPFLLTVDDNGADDRTPAWSPDSRWIVFSSNRENDTYAWYAIDMSGDIQRITDNDRQPDSVSFISQSP